MSKFPYHRGPGPAYGSRKLYGFFMLSRAIWASFLCILMQMGYKKNIADPILRGCAPAAPLWIRQCSCVVLIQLQQYYSVLIQAINGSSVDHSPQIYRVAVWARAIALLIHLRVHDLESINLTWLIPLYCQHLFTISHCILSWTQCDIKLKLLMEHVSQYLIGLCAWLFIFMQ